MDIKVLFRIRYVWDIGWIKSKRKIKKLGCYEINNLSFCCFDDTIYIQNNGYDRLALGC